MKPSWTSRFGVSGVKRSVTHANLNDFQTEDDYSVTNVLYGILKYHTASHTTTKLYAYHLLPGYRCTPWIPLCRYLQHLHIHRNDQKVFYCLLGYHSQQSADGRRSVKRMCTHIVTMPKTLPFFSSFQFVFNFPLFIDKCSVTLDAFQL